MRIAQVAPLYESVPPKTYGGTERVVSYLTEELVQQGHDVTLFASGDSETGARLISPCRKSLRLDTHCVDQMAYHILLIEKVFKYARDFDLIHFHVDYLHFPRSRRERVAHVTTLHGRLDLRDLVPIYREFDDMPVISISNAQRRPLPWANWQATVYHGLPDGLYTFHAKRGKYLSFLGRISPEKGTDEAIQIAKRAGIPLKIAAKVDRVDREYFENIIKPLLNCSLVEYIGEVGEREKDEFLGNSLALLSPVNWPEPFGLVMIEAMACGTPVVAYDCGSIPEIVQDGVTGFIVKDLDFALEAVAKIPGLSRKACRRAYEERFTASRMRQAYLAVYENLLESSREMAVAL
ncbi:MAG: glycosyltransferase family 4 protein [Terriglobia bacterium]